MDRVNYSFKKLVGRQYTSDQKEWYEEYAGKQFTIHNSFIWADDIPATPPATSTSIIEVYDKFILTADNTVADNKAWIARQTPGDNTSEQLRNWIPPIFGQSYTVRVFDNNDNEIFTTDPSGWFFDYENGILTFTNNPANYGWATPIKITAYRYIGTFGISGGTGGSADTIQEVIVETSDVSATNDIASGSIITKLLINVEEEYNTDAIISVSLLNSGEVLYSSDEGGLDEVGLIEKQLYYKLSVNDRLNISVSNATQGKMSMIVVFGSVIA